MINPEQEQFLSTISALAHSLRGQTLTDLQLDQLQIVERLLTNLAVQKATEKPEAKPEPVEYQIGEQVMLEMPTGMQLTTVIDKVAADTGYEYKTAATGRTLWIGTRRLQKVSK